MHDTIGSISKLPIKIDATFNSEYILYLKCDFIKHSSKETTKKTSLDIATRKKSISDIILRNQKRGYLVSKIIQAGAVLGSTFKLGTGLILLK